MTRITFKTPFVVLIGVVLLPILSLQNYASALEGFISEPLFWSSGFACTELAFLLLIFKFTESERTMLINISGDVLTFCYGVFVTVILALMIQDISFFKGALITTILITMLMMLIDLAYKERFISINNWFSNAFNKKATEISVILLKAAMFVLLVIYFAFVLCS